MNHFGYIIDSFYTRKHVSQKKTAIAQEIVDNVRDEFVDMLEKTPYLSQTKGAFVEKAKQTTSSIGYTTTVRLHLPQAVEMSFNANSYRTQI